MFDQICCRRLSRLLYIMSNPIANTITANPRPRLFLCHTILGILRQFSYKISVLWDDLFHDLRSWETGRRDKARFPRQKAALAASLAQVYQALQAFIHGSTLWANIVGSRSVLGEHWTNCARNFPLTDYIQVRELPWRILSFLAKASTPEPSI